MEDVENYEIDGGLANVRPTKGRTSLVVYPAYYYGPFFTVNTLHISSQSDTYCNGETHWKTDSTHCKSGYVVIMQTDTKAFKVYERHGETNLAKYMASFTEKHLGNLAKV